MSACPNCKRYREGAEEAREALRQAAATEQPLVIAAMRIWGMTRQEAQLFVGLVTAHGGLSHTALSERAGFGGAISGEQVKVVISRVRKKAAPLSVRTAFGEGYFVTAEDADAAMRRIKECA